jgi:hypothetical protein
MSTITYDPLIGKTSECDANNRITYYEYDNQGRMRFIKDEKQNIVKMYEYNNVSKQNGCPGVYYSRYTAEIFKRNCGPGYLSDDYVYIIPAQKYSSTISQEDADAKVQNELLSMGQAAANANGVCKILYCNDARTITVFAENCQPGYKGAPVSYTVPAGRYCTTESKVLANELAQEELEANAQASVNNQASPNCVPDYDPNWEADPSAPTQCQMVNGQMHLFILAVDVNPNSSSYGQTSWKDLGPSSTCNTACTNCSQVNQKCINGVCTTATKVCLQSYYDHSVGMFYNVYYYQWSDGTRTTDIAEYDFCNCEMVQCF